MAIRHFLSASSLWFAVAAGSLALSVAVSASADDSPARIRGLHGTVALGRIEIRVDPLTGKTLGRVRRLGRGRVVGSNRSGPVVNDFFTVDFPSGGFRCADCGYSCSPGDTRTIESNFLMTDAAAPGAEITALGLGNMTLGGSAASQVSELFDPEPFCNGDPARWDHVVTLSGCTTFSLYYDLFGVVVEDGLDRVWWSDLTGDEIVRLATDALPATPPEVVVSPINPLGIALDQSARPDGGKLYWSVQVLPPPNGGQTINGILRADLDGSDVEVLVDGLSSPIGVALDLVHGKMYWTEHSRGAIARANLDGSGVSDVLTGLNDPIFIALDVAAGRMYWTDHDGRRIRRASMADGSGLISLGTGGGAPEGIVLDLARGWVYWTETTGDQVQRADLDLGSRQVVAADGGFVDLVGIAVDVPGQVLWLADYNALRVQRYDLVGGVLSDVRTGLSGPWDVDLERAPCGGSLELPADRWQGFSVPCQLGPSVRLAEVLAGAKGLDVGEVRVVTADPLSGAEVELGPGDRLEPGRAYWGRSAGSARTVALRGVRADTSQLFEIPLAGGADGVWQAVGQPFDFAVPWGAVRVRYGGEIAGLEAADPLVDGVRACATVPPRPECVVAWGAEVERDGRLLRLDAASDGAAGRLEPFDVVWLQVFRDATLLVPALPAGGVGMGEALQGAPGQRPAGGGGVGGVDGDEGGVLPGHAVH